MSSDNSADASPQYTEVESMLPFGELLLQASEGRAVRVTYADSMVYDRKHWWITTSSDHPAESGQYVGLKFTETQRSVVRGDLEDAVGWLSRSEIDDGRLVDKRTVPLRQTPIPYKTAPTVVRRCPECGAWGQTHEWKFQRDRDELLNGCACCDYGGELDVERRR